MFLKLIPDQSVWFFFFKCFFALYLNVLILAVLEPNFSASCSSGDWGGGVGGSTGCFSFNGVFNPSSFHPPEKRFVSVALIQRAVLHFAMQHERSLVLSGFLTQSLYFEDDWTEFYAIPQWSFPVGRPKSLFFFFFLVYPIPLHSSASLGGPSLSVLYVVFSFSLFFVTHLHLFPWRSCFSKTEPRAAANCARSIPSNNPPPPSSPSAP